MLTVALTFDCVADMSKAVAFFRGLKIMGVVNSDNPLVIQLGLENARLALQKIQPGLEFIGVKLAAVIAEAAKEEDKVLAGAGR